MFRVLTVLVTALTLVLMVAPASAGIVARIDLSAQQMNVYVDGRLRHSWPVSTGRGRYRTPRGTFRPTVMRRMHYSSRYNNSPMPYSIFFHRGYAIHGTHEVSRLGRRASHGCVRLHPRAARTLFYLVRRHGPGRTRIVIRR
ncbi:L,D-transpeptidase [Dichotomicrobium thermohalophilum]|uniref:L,D-transpeptidase-like protein n=1 Tax=Dichotomicrobium thermohalophilum TaxID=933063 RepID=A0A397PKD2_9HYPH|nr:L,D-transpeptidase [Dichotomicrobium thermohalophilum]RIA47617.1 L,D-transpeptidase-like protein [Dichotomicrobium thermohalophilum]